MRLLPKLSRSTALALPAGTRSLMPAPKSEAYRSPEAALAVLLGVDNSGSMAIGGALAEQQAGLELFGETVRKDALFAGSLLVGMTGFGNGKPTQVLLPLTPASQFYPPKLTAHTSTPFFARLVSELGSLVQAGDALGQQGDRDLHPSMGIYFSDGQTDDPHLISQAMHATQVMAREARIELYFVGVGKACDMPTLERLAQPGRPALHMRELKDFRRFFAWLYRSLRQKSQSVMGDEVEMPHPFDERQPPLRGQG